MALVMNRDYRSKKAAPGFLKVLSISALALFVLSFQLNAQIKRDKVLFIAIGDTEDLIHKQNPESFQFEIGEECEKSIANIEKVARSIPELRTKVEYFSGKNFSKKALLKYLQNESVGKEMDSAAVVILYLISHGEADTSLREELPIVHFPDGKLRTVDLRNSLHDDGENQLVMLLVAVTIPLCCMPVEK